MRKVVIGIDISKDKFHACIKVRINSESVKVKGTREFDNESAKGFDEFLTWVSKHASEDTEMIFVMEATGVYYENLAYFLDKKGLKVSVILANKIKNFAKSLNLKSKTDKTDSKLIADFGMERVLDLWKPMSSEYKELRDLTREYQAMKKDRQRAMSQLHAMKHAHEKSPKLLQLKEIQVKYNDKGLEILEQSIREAVDRDASLKEKIRKVQTVPGLGFMTVVILACETNGFKLFKNMRQLNSYAGLDVVFNESGLFKGKTRISKRGNSRIRQALYMPSLSAIQANQPIKELYLRLCEKNPKIRKIGVVAGMRKLLNLAYVLWKKDAEYDPGYKWE